MSRHGSHARFRSRLLFALCCAFVTAKAEDNVAAAQPDNVIRDFYHWYVQDAVAHVDPITKKRSKMKRYATARLLREIDGMITGPDGLDGDYFLDAQDFDKDWGKNIKVSAPIIRGDEATAEVELRGAEMGTRKLRVKLVRERGIWKVDKVEGRD